MKGAWPRTVISASIHTVIAMSLLEAVQEKLRKEGINDIPRTVKNIIEFAERHGADIDIRVEVPRPRDPILYINGKPVVAWIKL